MLGSSIAPNVKTNTPNCQETRLRWRNEQNSAFNQQWNVITLHHFLIGWHQRESQACARFPSSTIEDLFSTRLTNDLKKTKTICFIYVINFLSLHETCWWINNILNRDWNTIRLFIPGIVCRCTMATFFFQ